MMSFKEFTAKSVEKSTIGQKAKRDLQAILNRRRNKNKVVRKVQAKTEDDGGCLSSQPAGQSPSGRIGGIDWDNNGSEYIDPDETIRVPS